MPLTYVGFFQISFLPVCACVFSCRVWMQPLMSSWSVMLMCMNSARGSSSERIYTLWVALSYASPPPVINYVLPHMIKTPLHPLRCEAVRIPCLEHTGCRMLITSLTLVYGSNSCLHEESRTHEPRPLTNRIGVSPGCFRRSLDVTALQLANPANQGIYY